MRCGVFNFNSMRFSDNPTTEQLANIMRGMGVDYTEGNVSAVVQALQAHPDEDIVVAIFRHTGLVKIAKPDIYDDMAKWSKEISTYSREYCLELVRHIPVTCLQEMFDNADKVKEWLEGDL